MLEAIERNEAKTWSRGSRRVNLALDASSIKMRRIVEEMAVQKPRRDPAAHSADTATA